MDRGEMIFLRIVFVIDEGGGKFRFAVVDGEEIDRKAVGFAFHAVDAIDAAIDIDPREEDVEPAWRDVIPLRRGDGGGGEVACGLGAEAEAVILFLDVWNLGHDGGM